MLNPHGEGAATPRVSNHEAGIASRFVIAWLFEIGIRGLQSASLRGATATKQSRSLHVERWIASLALAMTAKKFDCCLKFE
jgi:hypothetical protein